MCIAVFPIPRVARLFQLSVKRWRTCEIVLSNKSVYFAVHFAQNIPIVIFPMVNIVAEFLVGFIVPAHNRVINFEIRAYRQLCNNDQILPQSGDLISHANWAYYSKII